MTLDQDASLQSILITFFEHIRAENFEACFHWAKDELQELTSPAFTLANQLDEQANISAQDIEQLSGNELLLIFCACYGYARHEVEESNWYLHAETLVRSGITALEVLPSSPLNKILQKFAAIQIDVCYIDRGIYTSQEWLMAEATQNIETHLASVSALDNELNEAESHLYCEHLKQEFDSYRHFSEGVAIIAELSRIRWGDPSILKQQMSKLRPKFISAVNALTDDDKYIMSTDLEALWPPLTFFNENRIENSGELFIERGEIRISYFASVNHIVTQELRQSLNEIVNNNAMTRPLHLKAWGASAPQRNMLNDIWAGIAQDFEDIYSWKLPELTMPFRNYGDSDLQLNFDIELIYYPMGIFALSLKAPLNNISASGVRHAMSLGTSFAMDQKMKWHGQDFGLLEQFAKQRFTELASTLNSSFDHFEKPIENILMFNQIENRYVSTLLDRVVDVIDNRRSPLTAKSLKSHFAYPSLVLPQRELRSAVDDWCLRIVTPDKFNLNQDCYNKEEFVFTNHHECVLGLLQQPNWVIEQSAEMMEVASAINNLFHLTNQHLDKQLAQTLPSTSSSKANNNISAATLEARIQTLTKEGECLKQFTHNAHWLLKLISAGSMMTFPDHTRMIQKVFQHMDFDKLHIRTQETLDKIQFRQDEILSETAKLHAKIKSRNTKRFTAVLSGSMALISVGALKDIFDILNGSKLGIQVSGALQVSIVSIFGLMLIILLINKNEGDR